MSESTAANHTTALLLHRIRLGDADARALLVERLQPLLQRFARGRVPQWLRYQQDTGDLVQFTWLRVLDRLPDIQSRHAGDLFAYLRTVLVNRLREALRSQGRAARWVDAAQGERVELLPAEAVDPDDWLAYEQSLAVLDTEHRALVLMRFEFGMSFPEMAEELGESADGVRMKLNRAITRMASRTQCKPCDG